MIIPHFDLQPQFKYMNYFIYTSHHFTPHGRYELNKLTSLPMCSFIAQLVEHCTRIAEVMGSNPVEALIFSGFFLLKLENLLRWSFLTLISNRSSNISIISYNYTSHHGLKALHTLWHQPTNLHILTERGMSHILTRIGQLWSSRKHSFALVQSPNSKIMNRCNIDFNFLE